MDDPNPYLAPQTVPASTSAPASPFGELVRSWEKHRLLYNAILLLPGIGVLVCWSFAGPISPLLLFGAALVCGIGANIAFFAGPLAEVYGRALFFRNAPGIVIRRVLFIGGLALSFVIMAVAAVLPWVVEKTFGG